MNSCTYEKIMKTLVDVGDMSLESKIKFLG
jgi:hypothetical protein